MNPIATRLRLLVGIVMLFSMIGASTFHVSAEEADFGTEDFETGIDEGTVDAAYNVAANCVYDEASGTSTCTFQVYSDGPEATAFSVPVCAPVIDAGGATDGGGVLHAVGNALTVVLSGQVTAGQGGGSYTVEADGLTHNAAGGALTCTEAQTDPPPDNGDQQNQDPNLDEGQNQDPIPNDDNQDFIPTDDPIESLDVPIHAYICEEDVAEIGLDPLDECVPAEGIEFSAEQDGSALDVAPSNDLGIAWIFDAEIGLDVTVAAITAGYLPLGETKLPVGENLAFTFYTVQEPEPIGSRLQIVNVICPTSGEPRTEWQVIEPNMFAVQSEPITSCVPNDGALFFVNPGDITATIDSTGSWREFLDPGDYTVTEDASGDSVEVTVYENSVSLVVATTYVEVPGGTIDIRRYVCTEGEEDGVTEIDVILPSDEHPGAVHESCTGSPGVIQLNEGTPFELDHTGGIIFDLPDDTYLLTDHTSGLTADVLIELDQTTYVIIREYILTGTVHVVVNFCADQNAGYQDPTDPSYWEAHCDLSGAGVSLTLYNEAGESLGEQVTDDHGFAEWTKVYPGLHTLGTDKHICAAFVNGSDASGGFHVTANAEVAVHLYGCAKIDDGHPGDGTDGGNGHDKHYGPGYDDGAPTYSGDVTTDLYDVTALPSTGSGPATEAFAGWTLIIIVLAAGAGAAGATLRRRPAA